MPSKVPVVYGIVRTDIGAEAQTVQMAHAAICASTRFGIPEGHILWITAVQDKDSLARAVHRAERAGVRMATFEEPDDDLGLTAACSEPVYSKRFWPGHRSGLGDLQKWKVPVP
jgi:hypothetical protein